MEHINYSINEIGKQEIRTFLQENHKKCIDDKYYFNAEMINAWAADAEFQLGEGNPATIELRSWDSVNGRTQEFRISESGVDKEIIIEENE